MTQECSEPELPWLTLVLRMVIVSGCIVRLHTFFNWMPNRSEAMLVLNISILYRISSSCITFKARQK